VWRDMTARGRSAARGLNHVPAPVQSLVGPLLSAPSGPTSCGRDKHSEVLPLTLPMTLYSRWLEMTLARVLQHVPWLGEAPSTQAGALVQALRLVEESGSFWKELGPDPPLVQASSAAPVAAVHLPLSKKLS
jgi:hypothetical protein